MNTPAKAAAHAAHATWTEQFNARVKAQLEKKDADPVAKGTSLAPIKNIEMSASQREPFTLEAMKIEKEYIQAGITLSRTVLGAVTAYAYAEQQRVAALKKIGGKVASARMRNVEARAMAEATQAVRDTELTRLFAEAEQLEKDKPVGWEER